MTLIVKQLLIAAVLIAGIACSEKECGPNEVYSTCHSSCQEDCRTRGKIVACHQDCKQGCACKPGYIRFALPNSKADCITNETCDRYVRENFTIIF